MLRFRSGRALFVLLLAAILPLSLLWLGQRSGEAAQVAKPANPLIVHEWGTFLSVQGSDGVALGGMVDSDEDLPLFVRERDLNGLGRASYLQKMETPVTYFYVDEPCQVSVRVTMPQGVLTHWYPSVQTSTLFGMGRAIPTVANARGSDLNWGTFDLIPDKKGVDVNKIGHLPAVRKDRPWNFVRDTDSAYVRVPEGTDLKSVGNVEKFLFYRGLGTLDLPLHVQVDECRAFHLTLDNRGKEALGSAFFVKVMGEGIVCQPLPEMKGESKTVTFDFAKAAPLKEGVPAAKKAVAKALVEAGLFQKEADAMVNNWEKSYFRTEGMRVLYLLPRELTDRTIPIEIKPQPWEMQRVMVGRIELLAPTLEWTYVQNVEESASRDAAVRTAALAAIGKWGRMREPILRRVLTVTSDEAIKKQAEELLKEKPKV